MYLEPIARPYLKHLNALQETIENPEYYFVLTFGDVEKFKCSACGNCCMQNWGIGVSKEYYDMWYDTFHSHPSGRFKTPFILEPPESKKHARIRTLPESNRCVFLEDNNHCFIHKNYGEEALAHVCRTYPRNNIALSEQGLGFQTLLQSCKTAPTVTMKNSQLHYKILEYQGERPLLSIQDTRFFEPFTGVLFMGGILDSLDHHSQGALQDFKALIEWFEYFTDQPLSNYSAKEVHFSAQQHLQEKAHAMPSFVQDPTHGEQALQWFFSFINHQSPISQEIIRLFNHLPITQCELTPAEQRLLDDYLKEYLRRQFLRVYFEMKGFQKYLYFQQLFRLSLFVLFIQLYAFVKRTLEKKPLDMSILIQSTNLIEIHYGHKQTFNTEQGIDKMSPAMCLESMKVALAIDLTQTPLV